VQNHANAQCNLGVCLYYGQGVVMNETEAAIWFARSSLQGHAKAQCNLGVCYKKGRGVPRDDAKAVSSSSSYSVTYTYIFDICFLCLLLLFVLEGKFQRVVVPHILYQCNFVHTHISLSTHNKHLVGVLLIKCRTR
jgi:hypothetical protein